MSKQSAVETRQLIIKLRKEGKSYREIAKIVGRCHNTVKKILDKFQKFKDVKDRPRSGRPKRLSASDERAIVREVRKNPAVSAVKIAENITQSSGVNVSASTIRRTLHSSGLHGRVPRKKPYISEKNQKRRLLFAKKYQKESSSFWENVLFSDESKFEIFGSRKPPKIWRSKNTEFEQKNLNSTIKHGGGSVMVWGCMASSGVGNLIFIDSTMRKEDYLNILRENLPCSVAKLGLSDSWVFQQDNDPKHTSKIVKEWLLYSIPKQLDHPPQSPDLNPIEHLWEYLDKQIRKRNISSRESLKSILVEEWQKIPAELTKTLVESMPRRIDAVLTAKGKQTRY